MLTDDDNNMKNITFFSGTRTHTCTHIYHNCGQTKKKMIQDGQSIFFAKASRVCGGDLLFLKMMLLLMMMIFSS